MPQKCKICQHPDLENINCMYINGVPLREIALHAGVSHTSVRRHRVHLPKLAVMASSREKALIEKRAESELVAKKERELEIEKRTGSALLKRIESLVDTLERTVQECEADKDRRNLIGAANAIKNTAELIARLTGELGPNGQVNVQVNVPSMRDAPEWPIFIRIIEKHPAIKAELNQALLGAGQ